MAKTNLVRSIFFYIFTRVENQPLKQRFLQKRHIILKFLHNIFSFSKLKGRNIFLFFTNNIIELNLVRSIRSSQLINYTKTTCIRKFKKKKLTKKQNKDWPKLILLNSPRTRGLVTGDIYGESVLKIFFKNNIVKK